MLDLGQIKILNNLTAKAVIERLKLQLSTTRPGSKGPMNNWKALSESLEFKGGESWFSEVRIEGNDYGMYLNEGINDIPFTPPQAGAGGASHSNYISMLQFWAIKKFGVNSVRAKKLAFAIAHSQKQKGSAPGNPGWINDVEQELSTIISEEYTKNTYFVVEREVNKILNIRI